MTRLHTEPRAALAQPDLEEKECGGSASFARDLRTLLSRSWPIVAALSISPATVLDAQELTAREQINVGVAQTASPQLRASAEAEKQLEVNPTRRFEYADHVANGIAMRNRTAGTIHLRGAPVCQAAYWRLSFTSTSRTNREKAGGTSPFSSTPTGWSPRRPKITTIHAGEWRATTPMWRTSPNWYLSADT